LLVIWLLLNQTVGIGQILVGLVLGFCAPLAMTALGLPKAGMRRPLAMARLAGLVVTDIVRSNIAVARIILRPGPAAPSSGFINIPLDLRSPYALAVLACVITSTPGTIWVSFDPAGRILTIHVLDLVDESVWIRTIKHRYERLLLEIFE
jgi:multicomponent K+:H+ antiporter subunit E